MDRGRGPGRVEDIYAQNILYRLEDPRNNVIKLAEGMGHGYGNSKIQNQHNTGRGGTKDEGIGTTVCEQPIPVLVGNRRAKRFASNPHYHKQHQQSQPGSQRPISTLGNECVPADSCAPNPECLEHFASHLSSSYAHVKTMEEQCKLIQEKAQEDQISINDRGKALTPYVVRMVFDLCGRLKVHESVTYAALELYERYMITFEETIMPSILNRTADGDKEEILERIKTQSVLRLGSAIQLASKMYQPGVYGSYVTSTQLRRAMAALSHKYTLDVVNNSEKRVVQMLGHKLYVVTTYDVIETMLLNCGLCRNGYRRAYYLSFKILNFVFVNKDEIYERMYEYLCRKYENYTRLIFRQKIEFNKLIQGALAVTGAFYVFKATGDPAFRLLERVPGVNLKDVFEFAMIALHLINQRLPSNPAAAPVVTPNGNGANVIPAVHEQEFRTPQ